MIAKKSAANSKSSCVTNKPDAVLHSVEVLEVSESIEASDMGADLDLSELIASLESPEIFEEAQIITSVADTAILDAAVMGAEAIEVSVAAATPTGVIEAGAAPSGEIPAAMSFSSVSDAVPAAATPKRTAIPRKHYTDKTERLKDKLGAGLAEYSVLTLADAGVTDAELSVVMENTMVIIRGMSGKAQNWAVKLIENLSGKKSSMSEVTARIFKLLRQDGFVTTGNTGNMYLNLLEKPYSPGAARAMGGNNLAMMLALRIIEADGKGRFVPNHDSLLLMKANSLLFASSPEAAEEDAELADLDMEESAEAAFA